MNTKRCIVCRQEFCARRKDKRHCGVGCRVHAHRIRNGVGTRQPRTKWVQAQKVDRLFGAAATALATAAVTRKLENEHTEREKAVAALEQEQETSAALRADNERIRAEATAEKERLRVEFAQMIEQQRIAAAERQERLLNECAEAAEERLRAVLRQERQEANRGLGLVYAQVRDLRFERARAVDEKRAAEGKNAELLKERDELLGRLAEAHEQVKRLASAEQDNASLRQLLDEKTELLEMTLRSREDYARLVEEKRQQQLRDVENLRRQLGEAAQQYQRLLQAKSSMESLLDEEIKSGDQQEEANDALRERLGQKTKQARRLAARLQEAQTYLKAALESYEALRHKYNGLVSGINGMLTANHEQYEAVRLEHDLLVEKLNGQITDYNALVGRFNALAAAEHERYEGLRLKFNTVVEKYNRLLTAPSNASGVWAGDARQLAAENARLVSERDWLKDQLTQKTEAIAWLEATVSKQRQSLERMADQPALPASGRSRHRRLGRGDAEDERIALESQAEPSSVWGSIKAFCTNVAVGGAVAATVVALGSTERSQRAIHAASQSDGPSGKRRIGGGGRRSLPASKGRTPGSSNG